jgi:hypothetical protein
MKPVLLLLAFVFGFAAPLAAETIRVRAGEHSGYTRLVLDGAANLDWTIGRTATGYALRPDAADIDYALERAERDLRAGRVTGLRGEDDVLFVDLDCICELKTYTLSGNRLVLDVSPGEPDPSAASEQPFEWIAEPVAESVAEPALPADTEPVAETQVVPDFDVGGETAGKWLTAEASPTEATPAAALPDLISGVLGGTATQSTAGTPAEAALAAAPDYSEFEAMLTETLARAAAEGFVDAPPGATIAGIDAVAAEVAGADGKTAYDIARGDLPAPAAPDLCQATAGLDFLNDSAAFEDRTIGSLLANAYDDDGTMQPAGAVELARFLMWRGYGAEAAQIFDLAGLPPDEGMLLTTAALALDGKAAAGDVTLDSFATCDGIGGLWSMLAGADASLTAAIDIPASITVYSAYPAHLRRIIGPLLATHLITHGYIDEARLVANVIPEGGGHDPQHEGDASDGSEVAVDGPVIHEDSLTDLTLSAAEGKDVAGELDQHIAKSGPDTHEAVLLQSQSNTKAGTEPDAAEIETLRALQADAGDGALRGELFVTELRRMLDASDFTGVIGRTAKAEPDLMSADAVSLETEAWSGLIALGSNLDVALALRRWPERAAKADLAPGIRDRLAERLIEIGPVVAEAAPDQSNESVTTAEPTLAAPTGLSITQDPKPVAAVKSTLDAIKDERAALEAILNGTVPPSQ